MDVPLDKVLVFLKETPPFSALPDEALDQVARRMMVEYLPRGEVFIRAGDKPPEFLYLIYKGAARLYRRDGIEETLVDLRSEGEGVGAAALIAGGPASYNAAATEDTICYLVPRDVFFSLCDHWPGFRAFSERILRLQTAGSPPETSKGHGQEALFTTLAKDIIRRPPVFCPPNQTIQAAARIMVREKVGSMVVTDHGGRLLGIFTDADLRRLVADGDMSPVRTVDSIMRPRPAAVSMEATGFEALLAMGRRGIHHLPVVHEGRLAGVVTQHDLSLLSGANPLALVKDVETAPSLEQLSQIQYSVDLLVENLLRRNLGALGIQSVITLVNDQLMRRLIDISRAELEARGLTEPSLAWAWVGCGSAGRKEQIMRTDHDCAIVYADPPPDRKNETQRYFLALAESVIGGLEQCGFPRCREGNMANNPRWCQSLGVWREYFNTWLTEADQGALRSAALFFDGRIIHGHEELTREIRRHVEGRLLENPSFFRNLAKSALAVIPPLGFFRQFVVEKSGEHENRLNLKKSGLGPLVDATRILTLWRLLPQTNTLDRLMALGENGVIEADLARDAALAFEFMFMLRVKNYIEGPKMDRLSFDWVHPGRLDKVSQKALKEAFRVVSRLQEAVTACLA